MAFKNTAKITGSWNASTGILTLSGTDSVSNYRTALRSITFANIQDGITAPPRTISFTVTDDGGLSSNTVTRSVNITTVITPPVLSGIETTPLVYQLTNVSAPPAPVTASIAITDYETQILSYTSIKITGSYVPGEDQLVIDSSAIGTLTPAWYASTGELVLSGLAPISTYLKALDGVVYLNHPVAPASPTLTPRTISFQVNDSNLLPSNIVTRNVVFSTTIVPPTVSINASGPLNYQEQAAAAAIAPALTVADSNGPNLIKATVALTAGYVQGQDSLVFANTGNIQGSWNPVTGVLTLSGSDTIANYQAALRSVAFYDLSNSPIGSTKTVSFSFSDGVSTSNVATQQINVQGINVPPVIATNSTGPVNYSQAKGPVAIVPAFTVVDPETNTLSKAFIQIVPGNYQQGFDLLTFANTSTITGNFDSTKGILTLTGVDSVSNYRAAIRTITYAYLNGTPTPSTKAITLSVLDGIGTSNTVTQSISVAP